MFKRLTQSHKNAISRALTGKKKSASSAKPAAKKAAAKKSAVAPTKPATKRAAPKAAKKATPAKKTTARKPSAGSAADDAAAERTTRTMIRNLPDDAFRAISQDPLVLADPAARRLMREESARRATLPGRIR